MQRFPREKIVLAVVVSSLIVFAFMLLVTTNTIGNVSAVEPDGDVSFEVYNDSNCEDPCTDINWEALTPGSVKNVDVYIKNKDIITIYLDPVETTWNWYPSEAPRYMTFDWDYKGQPINVGETLRITLTLSVSRSIKGISSFSFDIGITGSDSLPGDVDGDGEISVLDLKRVKLALAGLIEEQGADLDGDDLVTILDLKKLQQIYDRFYG